MSDQKTILITGGATGLGKAIAERLVSRGHTVYCTSRRIENLPVSGAHFLQMDVTSESECQAAVNEIIQRENRLDVIINNAGITLSGPTLGFSVEDFRRLLDTNVVGSFCLIKAALAQPQKPKLVINITSLNGFLSFPNFGLYSASKFALEALGLALRYELSPETRVVNVAPGALRAESAKKMPHRSAREKIPLLNWLMPLTSMQEVARVIDRLIQARSVPARVLIGRDTHIIHLMQKFLPFSIFDRIVFLIWRKK